MGLRVSFIAADSMGVRSLSLLVEAGGLTLGIDLGASYAPRRYGLPPHPLEERKLREVLEEAHRAAERADVIIITHYHYDHYLYREGEQEYYRGKYLLVKDPLHDINVSQRLRAHRFLKKMGVEDIARRVDVLDSRRYEIDGVIIEGSPPVPHGPEGTKLGNVVMVMVEYDGERLVYASDVQGPMSERATRIIERWRPDILVISGPPTYFAGFKVPEEDIEKGLRNLERLAASVGVVVADHHFARDLRYPEYMDALRRVNRSVLSAAEFMGRPLELLEARRKELWRSTHSS